MKVCPLEAFPPPLSFRNIPERSCSVQMPALCKTRCEPGLRFSSSDDGLQAGKAQRGRCSGGRSHGYLSDFLMQVPDAFRDSSSSISNTRLPLIMNAVVCVHLHDSVRQTARVREGSSGFLVSWWPMVKFPVRSQKLFLKRRGVGTLLQSPEVLCCDLPTGGHQRLQALLPASDTLGPLDSCS
jgi:hypothetical protein